MCNKINRLLLIFIFIGIFTSSVFSQISPGELAKVHASLEGMSKCTQCHVLGEKVANNKCLTCHTEIKERIDHQKGYHSSALVKGKECASCHSDHHGKNFQIVRFDPLKFQHNVTGYNLEGAHSKKKCTDCHTPTLIANQKIKTKTYTYLGLKTECLSCHADYHQKTLPGTCTSCHGQDSFKPALKFNHAATKFPLIGKHQNVDCSKCHKIETKEGKKFQNFTGVQFNNCNNCHADVHHNQFGQNCRQCHSENSFQIIKGGIKFDHNKTGYKLEGKHASVNCISCHKTKYTDPVKHNSCNDCHADYHKNQFAQSGITPDCAKCHTINGFSPANYTLEQHNQSAFKLQGSHMAAPCFECHKKSEKWNFRGIGKLCADCHNDIHQPLISTKYYPNKNCKSCHTDNRWNEISFDHSQTDFKLTGAHATTNCRSCHFNKNTQGHDLQRFSGLPKTCTSCHNDKHFKQFERNGITDCNECHGTDNWKAGKFNHDNTAFKLDGKHQNVACAKCHKTTKEEQYIVYKIKKFKCESCHLP
jgi:hypothetical protein